MKFTYRSVWAYCLALALAVFLTSSTVHAFSVTVDNDDDVGWDTSLGVVNGWPAISYFDNLNGWLKYARAKGCAGKTWGAPVVVDANPGSGLYTSLAVVNGNPAISYYYATGSSTGKLMYVRATDPDGTVWGTPVVVDDTTVDVGWDTSLVVVQGKPAISYFDADTGQLRYVRATDVNGATWGTPVIVDGDIGAGLYTSMAVINDNPAISYYYDNFPAGEVRYVRASNNDGSIWATPPVTLASFDVSMLPLSGYDASFPLAVIDGKPAVSFMDWDALFATYQLHFIRAEDAGGATWSAAVTVDSSTAAGVFSSLQEIEGRPAIAYFEAVNGILKYIQAESSDGATWGEPLVLDNSTGVGEYCSLEVIFGKPAVSYRDAQNDNLKYFGHPSPLLRLILPAISSKGAEQESRWTE